MEINEAIFHLKKRADMSEPAYLVETFVDVGTLIPQISSHDHQIIYGRRGTGKTHALRYLQDLVLKKGELSLFIDMRKLGSGGSVYGDSKASIVERGTKLLCDLLIEIQDLLTEYVIENSKEDWGKIPYDLLDSFADQITQTKVVGNTEVSHSVNRNSGSTTTDKTEFKISQTPSLSLKTSDVKAEENSEGEVLKKTGTEILSINFGDISRVLEKLIEAIKIKRVWILLDEWSVIPTDLQPLLADLLRRAFFTVRTITIKIGAIEHRSLLYHKKPKEGYIGIELGADAFADTNLDDFMVFDNDSKKASSYFREFLFKHLAAILNELKFQNTPKDSQELIGAYFTQSNAFDELVRAAEGVPRDAINILSIAAQKAGNSKISISNVRAAAQVWYQRDKQKQISSTPELERLLHWIIDEVIKKRRARAFLLQSNISDNLIDLLFDARVLHTLKKSVSAQDIPGKRFTVYGLDYGCYIDLIATAHAPQGLMIDVNSEGGDEFIEVPPTDFRSIRRSILSLEDFNKQLESN